jgi:DNA-binding PadR family transcriptional regulator
MRDTEKEMHLRKARKYQGLLTTYEQLAFAFVCYGCPSLSEIQRFCALCGYEASRIKRALRSLCRKGFVVIHRQGHRRKEHNSYTPIFYTLTEAGSKLFKENYVAVMDFLVNEIVFKCASRGNPKIMNRFMEQRAC